MHKILSFILIFTLIFSSCKKTNPPDKKELLVFCGITMVKPIAEIAEIIEKQENCKIIIIKGGSENIYKSIQINKKGDLYIPGSETYIEKGFKENIISDTVFVGINKAVMLVQKGNPNNIDNNLDNLMNEKYKVVIGNPYSGSVGKETKTILDKKGIFDEVSKNVSYYTTDSKDLIPALKKKEADIVINWYATSVWDDNKNYVDVLEIDTMYAKEKKLYLSLLKYSKYPDISKAFMKYAASDKGKEIFLKYGFK